MGWQCRLWREVVVQFSWCTSTLKRRRTKASRLPPTVRILHDVARGSRIAGAHSTLYHQCRQQRHRNLFARTHFCEFGSRYLKSKDTFRLTTGPVLSHVHDVLTRSVDGPQGPLRERHDNVMEPNMSLTRMVVVVVDHVHRRCTYSAAVDVCARTSNKWANQRHHFLRTILESAANTALSNGPREKSLAAYESEHVSKDNAESGAQVGRMLHAILRCMPRRNTRHFTRSRNRSILQSKTPPGRKLTVFVDFGAAKGVKTSKPPGMRWLYYRAPAVYKQIQL